MHGVCTTRGQSDRSSVCHPTDTPSQTAAVSTSASMDHPPTMGGTPSGDISAATSDPDATIDDKYKQNLAKEGTLGRALDASRVFKWSRDVRDPACCSLA